MKKIFLLPAVVFLAASCSSQKTTSKPHKAKSHAAVTKMDPTVKSTYPQDAPAADIIRLKEGQNIFSEQYGMNITFTRALQDSRCPMNARCIAAGSATVEIELMATTSRPLKFQLSTGDLGNERVGVVKFNGYEISLESLYPANSTEVGFKELKGKYVIDLKITKATS